MKSNEYELFSDYFEHKKFVDDGRHLLDRIIVVLLVRPFELWIRLPFTEGTVSSCDQFELRLEVFGY